MIQALKKSETVETLSVGDYIAHADAQGFLSENATAVENDPRTLKTYFDLLRAHYPEDDEPVVKIYAGGYGFYLDPIDAERDGLNWAMSTPVIDGSIGVSAGRFAADLPALCNSVLDAGDVIFTDSFSYNDGYGDLQKEGTLVRLHSPVADIAMPFDRYLESLTSERRKKYRRMVSDFESSSLTFKMSDQPLTSQEMEMIRTNLETKWGEEAGYAFRQTLYARAAQTVRPQQCLVMRVMDGDALVFVQTMIVRGTHIYCQSIAKDEQKFFSGLAAFTDFKCIEALCANPAYKVFDPSCRTSLNDPESIGIAKRATVNKDFVKSLLVIGMPLSPEIAQTIQGKEA